MLANVASDASICVNNGSMQALIVKTSVAVVQLTPWGTNNYTVWNVDKECLGSVEKLDTGRWINNLSRVVTYRTAAAAISPLQRAAQ